MHAPIINMNNVHALFKLNVSAFEALHVDINFKMHKFAVFDHGGGGLKFQIPTASQSEGTYTVYFVCFRLCDKTPTISYTSRNFSTFICF